MARCKFPAPPNLWQTHVTRYVGIFTTALQRLSKQRRVLTDEDLLSESLCPILQKVCFDEQCKNRNIEIRVPDWEKPIQPSSEAELKGGKIRKRPDFSCKLTNPHANRLEDHELSFHVECKRLGIPTSSGWALNKNYVTEGMKRFDSNSHEYGKRVPSGMMIGYIVSMNQKEILAEVNSLIQEHLPSSSRLKFEFQNQNVQQYSQVMTRKFVKPQDFQLAHLWADFTKPTN